MNKVKKHFKENKKAYLCATAGLVVGAGLATAYFCGRKSAMIDITQIRVWSPGDNINQLIIPALGDPGNVVQCLETGTIYASQNEAARALGESAKNVSKHLHGEMEHVIGGLHLTVLGKAGQPIAN